MTYFARPGVAIAFGAFMLCAETCLHAESFFAADATAFELPLYDWTAGAFLLIAGVMSQRSSTLTRRQYQAAAWAFMLSLLLGALRPSVQEWLILPNTIEWGISEGMFVGIILTLVIISFCGLVGTLNPHQSTQDTRHDV